MEQMQNKIIASTIDELTSHISKSAQGSEFIIDELKKSFLKEYQGYLLFDSYKISANSAYALMVYCANAKVLNPSTLENLEHGKERDFSFQDLIQDLSELQYDEDVEYMHTILFTKEGSFSCVWSRTPDPQGIEIGRLIGALEISKSEALRLRDAELEDEEDE